jgi:hypothetical protein
MSSNKTPIAINSGLGSKGSQSLWSATLLGVLRHVKYKGEPLVKGKHVTGFTNGVLLKDGTEP